MDIEKRVKEIMSQPTAEYAKFWWQQGFSSMIDHAQLDKTKLVEYLAISVLAKPAFMGVLEQSVRLTEKGMDCSLPVGDEHYLMFTLDKDMRIAYRANPYAQGDIPNVQLFKISSQTDEIRKLIRAGLINPPEDDYKTIDKNVFAATYPAMQALLTAAANRLYVKVHLKFNSP